MFCIHVYAYTHTHANTLSFHLLSLSHSFDIFLLAFDDWKRLLFLRFFSFLFSFFFDAFASIIFSTAAAATSSIFRMGEFLLSKHIREERKKTKTGDVFLRKESGFHEHFTGNRM